MSILRRTLLLVATLPVIAAAQSTPPPPADLPPLPGDSAIRITLLTMGQGDAVWEMFGHNAIWVRDPATGTDTVYNWGVFDFRSEGFLVRFLRGDMRYLMVGDDVAYTLMYYQQLNRRMWAQELDLTPGEKRALVEYIRWHARPENRQYRYDYYLDNCSTRVRDAIDRVLRGRLREYLRGIPTDETYRSHSLRMLQGAPLLNVGIEMALGRPTDRRLSADQASFLPVQFMTHLRGFKRPDGKPLVAREYVLNEAPSRGPEPANVPRLWIALVPIGLLIAGLLWLAFTLAPRWLAVTAVGIVAGLFGLIGTIMGLLATVTDHVAAHANENMLLLNPLWLVVAVVVPLSVARGRARGTALWTSRALALIALGAPLLHVTTLSRQPNWDIIGLVLPSAIVVYVIARTASQRDWVTRVSRAGREKNAT